MTRAATRRRGPVVASLHFTVPGAPKGKERPRLGRGGNVYTPAETKRAEEEVGWLAKEAGAEAMEGPLVVNIIAYYPMPKAWSKQRRDFAADGGESPLVKPDIDNVEKLVLDALKHIAWNDDSQVVQMRSIKFYGEEPRTEVIVEPFVWMTFRPRDVSPARRAKAQG